MRVLEQTSKKLILEDRPPIQLLIYLILPIINFLLIFFFKVVEIPAWIFAVANILAIIYFMSKIKYMMCVIDKGRNTIDLNTKNFLGQKSYQNIKISNIQKINFIARTIKGNKIYEIVFL